MSRKKQRGEEFKQEDILQAVVICDSFNTRFLPLVENKPKVLFPLANIPLLNYTLEFLCSAGIQEVILFCKEHSSSIKAYLNQSKWLCSTSPMDIVTIVSEDCMSIGDALRDIDAKSLINNDFILLNGDVVANVKLTALLEAHKQRRLKDKSTTMTLLMKKAQPLHRTRNKEDEVAICLKKEDNRILTFRRMAINKKLHIPLEMFKEHKHILVRHDLLDCQIAICSPLVPQLFTDNFDYLTREDFIKGILENEEILGNTIYLHMLENEYAARVTNLNMYDAVSKDVLSRWAYPLVPDTNLTDKPDDTYSHGRHNTYRHKDITLARGCVLQQGVLIGKSTSVGSNTIINQSVIGKNCCIGENVKLQNAYLMDGVVIGDNCQITTSILDRNVHLKSGVTLQLGCILGENVVVGPDITLPQATLLSSSQADDVDASVVGSEGRGCIFQLPADSDDEYDDDDLITEVMGLRIESEEDEHTASSGSDSDDDADFMHSPPPDEFKLFFDEVIGTLDRAVTEDIGLDNMILEINSLKHGYGIQIREVNQLVTKAILELPFKVNTEIKGKEYLAKLIVNFKKLMAVLKNYIKSGESQKDCLIAIESLSLTNGTVAAELVKVLHYLYNADILSEEAVISWYNTPAEGEDAVEKAELKKKVTDFVTWLEEAEEEDSDEESD